MAPMGYVMAIPVGYLLGTTVGVAMKRPVYRVPYALVAAGIVAGAPDDSVLISAVILAALVAVTSLETGRGREARGAPAAGALLFGIGKALGHNASGVSSELASLGTACQWLGVGAFVVSLGMLAKGRLGVVQKAVFVTSVATSLLVSATAAAALVLVGVCGLGSASRSARAVGAVGTIGLVLVAFGFLTTLSPPVPPDKWPPILAAFLAIHLDDLLLL